MFRKFFGALAALVLLDAVPARAGSPIERDVTCPIDGRIFKRIDTVSCTTFGFSMSLRRRTSCDFVTVLPLCPSNLFPVYRDFSGEELALLRDHVKSMDFKRLMKRSRFYVAWQVETWLQGKGLGRMTAREKFGLLISGLSLQPHRGIGDGDYRKLILKEAHEALKSYTRSDQEVLAALMAFVEIHDGQKDAAARRLKGLQKAAAASPPLKLYVDAVLACLKDAAAPTCDPNAPIPQK